MISNKNIEIRYQYLCDHASDINQHLPTLREYGEKVDHITEFGVRSGVSTVAFLHAHPKQLISYDINPYSLITNEHCPMTFVKTKLELEKLKIGEILEVILNKGEPLENVPSSAEEQGYTVREIIQINEGKYKVVILK